VFTRSRSKPSKVKHTCAYPRRLVAHQSVSSEYCTGWVKKVSCCNVVDISKARQYSPDVKYSVIL